MDKPRWDERGGFPLWAVVLCLGIIACIILGNFAYNSGYDSGLAYGLTHQDDVDVLMKTTYTLSESGYIDDSYLVTESWQDKYNELYEAYKHTVWHYDAQAENLRIERNGYLQILKDIGYYHCSSNFTLESENITVTGETWTHKPASP